MSQKIHVLTLVTQSDVPEELLTELRKLGQVSLMIESSRGLIQIPPQVGANDKHYVYTNMDYGAQTLLNEIESGSTLFEYPGGILMRVWNDTIYLTYPKGIGSVMFAVMAVDNFKKCYNNKVGLETPTRLRQILIDMVDDIHEFITPPRLVTDDEVFIYLNWDATKPFVKVSRSAVVPDEDKETEALIPPKVYKHPEESALTADEFLNLFGDGFNIFTFNDALIRLMGTKICIHIRGYVGNEKTHGVLKSLYVEMYLSVFTNAFKAKMSESSKSRITSLLLDRDVRTLVYDNDISRLEALNRMDIPVQWLQVEV